MKKLAILLFGLGVVCIALYFVMGPQFSNVKVTFNSNGGTAVSEQVLKNGEKAIEPAAPAKENSEFQEWQYAGQKYDFNTPVTSNITLNAIWNDIKYYSVKMSLEGNDYAISVREERQIIVDDFNAPVKDGYKIVLYNEDGTAYNMNTPVTTDLNLTGKYELIKKYKVTFDSNGGSKVTAQEVVTGETAIEQTTTRDGYEFDGWYLNNTKYDFTTPVTSNIILKARWTEKGKVNVIFMVDSKVYKTVGVKEGTKVSKPTNPTKSGYRFVEWQLDGSKFDFNTKIESETTLTAVFEEVSTYTVKFDSDGGSKVDTQEVDVDGKVTKPTSPTKTDYEFVEWQLNGKTYDFNKKVTSDMTLKAKWKKVVKYTVKFNSNGGSAVADITVNSGQTIQEPTVTRSGFRLDCWVYENSPFDFSTPITKNITLTARWVSTESQNPDIIEEPTEGNE